MKRIANFVGGYPIHITATVHPQCGPLVSIGQDIGAMNFLHSMTPAQAMEAADALIAAATSLITADDRAEVAHA